MTREERLYAKLHEAVLLAEECVVFTNAEAKAVKDEMRKLNNFVSAHLLRRPTAITEDGAA